MGEKYDLRGEGEIIWISKLINTPVLLLSLHPGAGEFILALIENNKVSIAHWGFRAQYRQHNVAGRNRDT